MGASALPASGVHGRVTVPASSGKLGQDELINVTVNETATGYINIIVNGEDHIKEIVNGNVSYIIENIQPGEYNITAKYLGDNNYTNTTSEIQTVTVAKLPTDISLEVTTPVNVTQIATIVIKRINQHYCNFNHR